MNTPYVKQYNDDGSVANPIEGKLESKFPNRRMRRTRPERFRGNHKGTSLTVTGNSAYFRVIQDIGGKLIEHYVLKKYGVQN